MTGTVIVRRTSAKSTASSSNSLRDQRANSPTPHRNEKRKKKTKHSKKKPLFVMYKQPPTPTTTTGKVGGEVFRLYIGGNLNEKRIAVQLPSLVVGIEGAPVLWVKIG